jgi:hypothetical protein
VRRGGRLVEDPLHVVDLGNFVRRDVGYRDMAAGRERSQQLGDDPGRVGFVGDEVQDGQEQQRRLRIADQETVQPHLPIGGFRRFRRLDGAVAVGPVGVAEAALIELAVRVAR